MNAQLKTQLEDKAPRTVYHMTHVQNLPTIGRHGLLAHNNRYQQKDISNRTVNNLRHNIIEPVFNRSIHDYVPFYFNPRNAMLYRVQKDYASNIVILEFSSEILLQDNALFTTGNAACHKTKFSNNIEDLATMNWNIIFQRSWYGYGEHVKRAMMSEVLVYQHQALNMLEAINCQTNQVADFLNNKYNSNKFIKNTELFF